MDRQVAMPAPTAPNPRNWGRINNGSSTRLAAPPKERPKEACPALPSARTRLAKRVLRMVAGLGIVKKLDQLPLYFSIGVSNGLLPLLAYHYAAGQQEKRRAAFRLGCTLSLAFALLCLVTFELFAPQLASLFIDDPATIHYSAGFLRRMVIAMPMMSLCYPMIIQFQAMGKARESLVCSILRKGVLDIPLLFLLDTWLLLYGCMWVQPIVDTISLIVAIGFYRALRRKEDASP